MRRSPHDVLLLVVALCLGCEERGNPAPAPRWDAQILEVAAFQEEIDSVALSAREDENHVAKLRRLLDEEVDTEVQLGAVCAVLVKLAAIGESRPEYLELARQIDKTSQQLAHFCEIDISQHYPIDDVWPKLRAIAINTHSDAHVRSRALLVSGWLEGWETHPRLDEFESTLWSLIESGDEPTLRMQALLELVKADLALPEETRRYADEIAAEDPEAFGREGWQREIRSMWP